MFTKSSFSNTNLKEKATNKELIKSYKKLAKKLSNKEQNKSFFSSLIPNKIKNVFSNKKSTSIQQNSISSKKERKVVSQKNIKNNPWEIGLVPKEKDLRKKALKLLLNKELQPTPIMRKYLYTAIKMKLKPDIFSNNQAKWLLLTKKEAQLLLNDIPHEDLKKIKKELQKEQHPSPPTLSKIINEKALAVNNNSLTKASDNAITGNFVESTITTIAQSIEHGMEI